MSDPLTKLYIEITTTCNLDCVMCVRRVWDEPIGTMSRAAFAHLMDQVRELDAPPTIHLSGFGEPTMHPDFLDLVRMAKETGAAVEMTSNGMRLDREMCLALMDVGLDRLVVSVDGTQADSFEEIRERASFERVIANLQELKRLRIRYRGRHGDPQLVLAFVAMRDNIADLPRLPALATKVGAWDIIVSNLVPHTPEMEQQILYADALNAITYRASRWAPALSLPKLDVSPTTAGALHGAFHSTASVSLLDASLSGRNDYCRFAQEGFAVVRWDGEVSPCLSLLHDHPEYIHGRRKEITRHRFGNVHDSSLQDIWESDEYRDFRAQLRSFPFSPCSTCGGCERFSANYVDCTGNDFPTCGACLWAQGFVQCA
jgi:MoaA/NifB/PqqE/SkfB family radical SAM enzyme